MNAAVVQTGNTSSNDGYQFSYKSHCMSGFQEMLKMQRSGKLCDVGITVGGEVYRVHKLVFASVSKYFYDLFDDEVGKDEIRIDGMSPRAFRSILSFFYTGEIRITTSNLSDLLFASKKFNISMLERACAESMPTLLNLRTWSQINAIAGERKCEEVSKKCHAYAVDHFEEIAEKESFLRLPFCQVKELVADDKLVVSSDEDVYSAVLKWVKHDLPNRGPHLSELMFYVKFTLMDKSYMLKNVAREPLMRDNPECLNLVLDATEYHLGVESEQAASRIQSRRYLKKYIFVAGGWQSDTEGKKGMTECEIYNPRTDTWSPFPSMQCKRSHHGLVGFRRLLYAFGGGDGLTVWSSAEYYDPLTDCWSMTTSLPNGRYAHGNKTTADIENIRGIGICSIDDSIYICGGSNVDNQRLNSVEKFDPVTATYMTSPPMNTTRSYFNVAVSDNCIYAIGGETDGYQALKSMEIFDPREGKWSEAPSKTIPGTHQSLAVHDGFIYTSPNTGVLGRNWERFNIRSNKWETISSTSNEEAHLNHDGCVYILGSCITSIQKYNPKENSVIEMPPMINKRDYISAVVMNSIDINKND